MWSATSHSATMLSGIGAMCATDKQACWVWWQPHSPFSTAQTRSHQQLTTGLATERCPFVSSSSNTATLNSSSTTFRWLLVHLFWQMLLSQIRKDILENCLVSLQREPHWSSRSFNSCQYPWPHVLQQDLVLERMNEIEAAYSLSREDSPNSEPNPTDMEPPWYNSHQALLCLPRTSRITFYPSLTKTKKPTFVFIPCPSTQEFQKPSVLTHVSTATHATSSVLTVSCIESPRFPEEKNSSSLHMKSGSCSAWRNSLLFNNIVLRLLS